jgi:hypothetical protein
LSTGLLIKPQNYLLTIAYLLLWALWQRRRRPFLWGAAIAGAFLWLIPALFEFNWVENFLASLGGYIPVTSVVDGFWNPYQLVAGALLLGCLALMLRERHAPADSPAFTALIALSLSIWALVVPIEGMFHVVAMPGAIILLLSLYQHEDKRLYRGILITLLVVYLAGWAGFLISLSSVELYGRHIFWSELAYKVVLPVLITAMALPWFWWGRVREDRSI